MRERSSQLESASINVILLNIHTSPGIEMLERFDFNASPLYLVFDESGRESQRSNSLDKIRLENLPNS